LPARFERVILKSQTVKMKKVLILLLAAAGLSACGSGDKKMTDEEIGKRIKDSIAAANNTTLTRAPGEPAAEQMENTTIQWLDSTFVDLGKKPEGKEIEISFRFKNTGNKPLVIQSVSASCGCTVPEKPEKPFAPGEEGVIKAKFNGIGNGEVRKDVHVTANTNPSAAHTLTFRTELIKK
jgi:hypothetical protein